MSQKAEIARITITRYLTDQPGDDSDVFGVETSGDADHLLTALGLLRLAEHSLLADHEPENDNY